MESDIITYQEQSLIIEYFLKKYASLKNIHEIKDYYSKIQDVFHQLKLKYPKYFSRLFFDENGHAPYSEDLDSIIQDFQVSGKIGKRNPGFNSLLIDDIDLPALMNELNEELPDVNLKKIDSIVGSLEL